MITKTYQAIGYQTMDMYVDVNGKRVLITFRGGSLQPKINGTFQTSDPDLQKVLEKDTARDILFQEIGSFDDEATDTTKTSEETIVEGITTVQAAREWLLSNVPGVTQATLPNKTALLAFASQNKIVFKDLK